MVHSYLLTDIIQLHRWKSVINSNTHFKVVYPIGFQRKLRSQSNSEGPSYERR